MLKVVWTLGDVVRKLREQRGWTQGDLGTRADVHQTVIGRLENNPDKSERATIERVARALVVSVADLYAYAEELSLASELTDAERRSVQAYQRRLIEKRTSSAAAGQAPPHDPPVTASESDAPARKRQRR